MKLKVIFDYLLALVLLPIGLPIICILIVLASIDTRSWGLFSQMRVGREAQLFPIYKIRTMRGSYESDITTSETHQISPIGHLIRKTKLDELPQLFNILLGHMSFVGPRPDVPGYADLLKGEDRIILSFKPGITGPAQLAFKNEDEILNRQENPIQYNDEVIWPEKVRINKEYVKNWNFKNDLIYLFKTII